MNSDLSFVDVVSRDQINLVAELAKEIWHQHYTSIIGTEQIEYMLDKFQSVSAIEKAICEENYCYFLLHLNETYAGYLGIQVNNGTLFLSKFYILSEFRGQKLARKSLVFLEELGKNKEIDSIWLTCNINNENTISAYKKLGFKVVDTQKVDIGNGYIMDDYIMEKQI